MKNILHKWGIDILGDEEYIEYLLRNFPNKTYFIDQLPLSVNEENAHKMDCIFGGCKPKNRIKKKYFNAVEDKYINLLTTLWMYNKVFVHAEKYTKDDLKRISLKYRKKYKNFQQKLEECVGMVVVDNKEELDYYIKLGTRGIAQASFYFENYEMIIVPSWSCFITYFNNSKNIDCVKKIVEVNGLFLRDTKEA